jgi:hypothetical protein
VEEDVEEVEEEGAVVAIPIVVIVHPRRRAMTRPCITLNSPSRTAILPRRLLDGSLNGNQGFRAHHVVVVLLLVATSQQRLLLTTHQHHRFCKATIPIPQPTTRTRRTLLLLPFTSPSHPLFFFHHLPNKKPAAALFPGNATKAITVPTTTITPRDASSLPHTLA